MSKGPRPRPYNPQVEAANRAAIDFSKRQDRKHCERHSREQPYCVDCALLNGFPMRTTADFKASLIPAEEPEPKYCRRCDKNTVPSWGDLCPTCERFEDERQEAKAEEMEERAMRSQAARNYEEENL